MKALAFHKVNDIHSFSRLVSALIKLSVTKFNNGKALDLLGSNSVLLTFDDGDASFYYKAFPVFKKNNISTVLFIISSLIDTNAPFWWDEVCYYLGDTEGQKKVSELKKNSNALRLKYLENLRKQSTKPLLEYRQLTIEQLLEMQEAGVVIANHSHTHPMFDQCTEAEIRNELRSSRKFFEDNGLKGYHIFAYPNGNFNESAERILKEEGIEYAFLFDHKLNEQPINPLRISRLSVNDNTPLWKLRFILSGWHSKILPVIKGLNRIKNYAH